MAHDCWRASGGIGLDMNRIHEAVRNIQSMQNSGRCKTENPCRMRQMQRAKDMAHALWRRQRIPCAKERKHAWIWGDKRLRLVVGRSVKETAPVAISTRDGNETGRTLHTKNLKIPVECAAHRVALRHQEAMLSLCLEKRLRQCLPKFVNPHVQSTSLYLRHVILTHPLRKVLPKAPDSKLFCAFQKSDQAGNGPCFRK